MTKTSFVALAAPLILAAGLAVAVPAEAVSSANCPSGATCIWYDKDYKSFGRTWDLVGFQHDIPHYRQWYFNDGQSADNVASSMHNNGTTTVYLFKNDSCRGAKFAKAAKATDGNFANGDPVTSDNLTANDQISSGSVMASLSSCLNS